jgi:prepilin-type N-terminal cleavage/methylation domain-containing protein
MGSIGDTAGALRRSERGFTLIELLVATTIGIMVLGGAVTVFLGAVRSEPRTSSHVTAVQEGRVVLERITRELRQGVEVVDTPTPTASQLALVTYVKQSTCGGAPAANSIACRVTFTCDEGACSRVVELPGGGSPGAPTQLVSGLATTNVFTYAPSAAEPSYVGVELAFSTQPGTDPVVVADGAALRNGGSS